VFCVLSFHGLFISQQQYKCIDSTVKYETILIMLLIITGRLFRTNWAFTHGYSFITGVGLEEGSWIVTSNYIGYTLGALLNGFLFHRINIPTMFAVCLMLLSVEFVSIPFCSIFGLTVAIFLSIGIMQGFMDAGRYKTKLLYVEKQLLSPIDLSHN